MTSKTTKTIASNVLDVYTRDVGMTASSFSALLKTGSEVVSLGGDVVRYTMYDGSAIIEAAGQFDLLADGCPAHCWAGVGCSC